MLKKLTLPTFLLAAASALILSPDSRLSAATCGGPGEVVCKDNVDCVSFIFYWKCTTRYDYWNDDEEEEQEEQPGDPETEIRR